MRPADKLIARLDGVRKVGSRREWWALCPVHGEKTPSLHVTEKEDGMVLIHCFGCGCNGSPVMDAIGLGLSDLYDEAPISLHDSGDKWRPEKRPAKFMLEAMQDEIWRLRARLGAK